MQEVRGWRSQPMVAQEHGFEQLMPETMPCLEYRRVWMASRPGAQSITVWRPSGPPGYSSLGDIAVKGDEPPSKPSRMYKDVAASVPDTAGEGPRLMPPAGYQLMYRWDTGNCIMFLLPEC